MGACSLENLGKRGVANKTWKSWKRGIANKTWKSCFRLMISVLLRDSHSQVKSDTFLCFGLTSILYFYPDPAKLFPSYRLTHTLHLYIYSVLLYFFQQ